MFLVSTLYQPAVLLCGVQDSQQQLHPIESNQHLQPQLRSLAKQKDLILALQSISIGLQVEDLKLKIIIQALCSWKLLHQTAGFCAKLHSAETCRLSKEGAHGEDQKEHTPVYMWAKDSISATWKCIICL